MMHMIAGCNVAETGRSLRFQSTRRRLALAPALVVAIVLLAWSDAGAAPSQITAADYGTVDTDAGTLNSTVLGPYQGTGFAPGRGVIEFDLSAIAGEASIETATLRIHQTQIDFGAAGNTVEIFGYSGDGLVEVADAALGSLEGSFSSAASAQTFNVDLTSFIQTLHAGSATHAGLVIRYEQDLGGVSFEVPGETDQPLLLVTPTSVPAPNAAAGLGLGLLALMLRRQP